MSSTDLVTPEEISGEAKQYAEVGRLLRHEADLAEVEEESPWLISYADLVTLLLTFFVMLISFSDVDFSKFEQVAESISKAIGKNPQQKVSLEVLHKEIDEFISAKGLKGALESSITPIGVSINIAGGYLFASGSADLNPKALPLLKELSALMCKVPYQIAIEGHTDDVPIQSKHFASNWELSTSRASGLVRLCIAQNVAASRLRAIGYADTRPVVPPRNPHTGNAIPKNRARNRRVVIQFLAF